MNTNLPPEELGDGPSSKVIAQAFSRAKLVKGFNHLVAAILDQDPAIYGGRSVVFLASDDEDAIAEIGQFAEKLGFSPVKLAGLSEGGSHITRTLLDRLARKIRRTDVIAVFIHIFF